MMEKDKKKKDKTRILPSQLAPTREGKTPPHIDAAKTATFYTAPRKYRRFYFHADFINSVLFLAVLAVLSLSVN